MNSGKSFPPIISWMTVTLKFVAMLRRDVLQSLKYLWNIHNIRINATNKTWQIFCFYNNKSRVANGTRCGKKALFKWRLIKGGNSIPRLCQFRQEWQCPKIDGQWLSKLNCFSFGAWLIQCPRRIHNGSFWTVSALSGTLFYWLGKLFKKILQSNLHVIRPSAIMFSASYNTAMSVCCII